MGVTGLRDLAVIEEISTGELTGETVSVDAYNYLYKYMIPTVQYTDTSEYTNEDGDELPAVLGLLRGLKRFYRNNITPVFVYDGSAHSLKAGEIAKRKAQKEDAQESYEEHAAAGNRIAAARHESRSMRLTGAMIAATQRVLDAVEIPYIEAHGAGEAQAAYMASDSEVISRIVSDDYDSLLFGAPSTVRNFTSSEPHERVSLEETLAENELTQEQLVWYALLCGTDYNDGAGGYGPTRGKKLVKSESESEVRRVLLENDESITGEHLDTILSLFMEPEVFDSYPEPTGLRPVSGEGLESVVYDEIGVESEPFVKAVESLSEELPDDASLSSWG